MTEKNQITFDVLKDKITASGRGYDIGKITLAFEFADKMHAGQKRFSGEPYITHPLSVAEILLDLGMDTDTICAALLHDVVEDTEATSEQVCNMFGEDVANMVEGVTKLTKTQIHNAEQRKEETIRKILVAMSGDVRIMIIKLADRLHNMRTLGVRTTEKQQSTAYETMNVYVPIANRLGIDTLKSELEDLSFYYLDKVAYCEIERLLANTKDERERFIENIKAQIKEILLEYNFIKEPYIEGRVKSMYGIYKKLYQQHKDFNEIYDKYAVRIILEDKNECFIAIGLIHGFYPPLHDRYKDYIRNAKDNMYQSLHTTVIGTNGIPFEVQVRTWEMHRTAEYGVAAHWKYKEGIHHKDKMDKMLSWVHEALASDNPGEIIQMLKTDFASDEIYVLTPQRKSIFLPVGATPIDFAYRIHTEVGHKMMAAKVNGRIVPLDFPFEYSGQICEILTSKDPNKGPSRSWLEIAKSERAKAKIRAWFKKERRDENIENGRANLDKNLKRLHIILPEEERKTFFAEDMERYQCETLDDFYAALGYGGISMLKMLPKWKENYQKLYQPDEKKDTSSDHAQNMDLQKKIIFDDIKNCVVKFAHCCNPVPGDEVVGFVTRGHGISVHTTSCTNYRAVLKRGLPEETARWFPVEWTEIERTTFQTTIEVIALDRAGLMADVSCIMADAHISMTSSHSRTLKNGNAIVEASISLNNKAQLNLIFDRLRKIKGVLTVGTAKS